MKNFFKNHFVLFLLLSGFVLISLDSIVEQNSIKEITNNKQSKKLTKDVKKKARDDFFFNIMRDPQTNSIPKNIRTKELNHAKSMPIKGNSFLAKSNANEFDWFEIGPNDVGGRTRALAVDVTNSNTVIAAGVSGGIWKSTNNGDTWEFKNKSSELLSITSIVQDPRTGFTNNWYACGGEFDGSSASDRGYRAYFRGNGILKSTDNGENWNLISSTSSNPTKWDSDFDYVSKLLFNPNTGSLFGLSNGFGIIKSVDGGESFSASLGGLNDHYYSDLAIKADGTLVAVLSSQSFNDTPANSPGVYKSTDDGTTWTDITPAGFPATHERSVIGTSDLSTPIFYILTNTGEYFSAINSNGDEFDSEKITLFKLSTDGSVTEDLTSNLPKFKGYFEGYGYIQTQGNYNIAIAVKPNDDDFVLIAGTCLFRSTDGFSTRITDKYMNWIGGSHDEIALYPNLHVDIHKITFDPNDPNKVWVGHDGGLSYSDNIANESYSQYFPWVNKNNGYNVTQFYTVSIHKDAGDNRIMGGTQDNGTPFFLLDNLTFETTDISTGDGAYCYFSSGLYAYTSVYNGQLDRLKYNSLGYPVWGDATATYGIEPEDAEGQLFINPFVIDPNPSERYMYYPAGNTFWRNSDIRQQNSAQPLTANWSELADLAMPLGHTITTLSVSNSNPEHVLYYGAYSSGQLPIIYRLENSHTATSGYTDVSVPDVENGAYIHDIAINPDDANEIITVFSNYNIDGLYHSTNGGTSYTLIEGNLTGDAVNAGPSLRRALIIPYDGSYLYFVATSTGLYSTTTLDGENTIWTLESPDGLGNVVVEALDYRSSDNTIAVGTHGRGIFLGQPSGTVDVKNNELANNFTLSQNYPNPFNPSTKIEFNLAKSDKVDLSVYNNLGERVLTLLNKDLIAGNYSVDFNGTRLASGIYYYKLSAGNFVSTKKMILIK